MHKEDLLVATSTTPDAISSEKDEAGVLA